MKKKKSSSRTQRTPVSPRKQTAQNGYQVFLSHATADKWIAQVICEKVILAGAEFFRDDRDIDGGDDIPEKIRSAIKKCHDFVVLLSPKSIDRDWVKLEMGAAWGRNKRVIVLLLHLEVHSIPSTFSPKKAYQLNDIEQYLSELAKRVQGGKS